MRSQQPLSQHERGREPEPKPEPGSEPEPEPQPGSEPEPGASPYDGPLKKDGTPDKRTKAYKNWLARCDKAKQVAR